jgi:integrase/recombinase XerC
MAIFFMPIDLKPPTETFLNYITFQKRYSRHTILSYKNDLNSFFTYGKEQYNTISVSEISSVMIRSWLASLKEQGITSKSINRKISTLKSFFKYHLKTGNITVNPMASVISLKNNRRLPSFISQEDLETLFTYVEFPDSWEGKTNHLLLMILYQTGIRLSELINIKESSIDYSKRVLKVLGKGNKERIIPLQQDLLDVIISYCEQKKQIPGASGDQRLIVNKKGKKLYPKYVYNVVKEYLGSVSTNEKKSPHILRHSFATHLTNNGADINAVKELLGHSSLASTQVYTHNTIARLKEVHKQAHPKS